MAPISKENDVLTAAPETTAVPSAVTGARAEDTSTGSRPQPVALEVPVTVNGARTVDGSDKREPFSETTKTVLVFGNGAVIRLGSPVAPGQLLFLTNEKTKKEVVCQVVKSKNYKSVSGYVELEFTESVVGFWGMRFPSDRIGPQATAPAASLRPIAKVSPISQVSAATTPANPVAKVAPKVLDTKPAQIPIAQGLREAKPTQQPRPPEVNAIDPAASKVAASLAQAPVSSPSLASSLSSLLSVPPASPISPDNKPTSAIVPGESSTEDLKLQAARLQEQLSSMLFSAAPAAKPVPPAAVTSAQDANSGSGAAAKVLKVAKIEPTPVKTTASAKAMPPPVKSSLDTEEVKIPSWLEPLARNAATPSAQQDPIEREKAKHTAEIVSRDEHSSEPLSLADSQNATEVELPGIGNLLPLDENTASHSPSSDGSSRGVLWGAIAAGVLLVAGGAWYFLRPTNIVQGTSVPFTPAASSQSNASVPTPATTQPAAQSAPQQAGSAPQGASTSNAAPISNLSTPTSSAPFAKSPVTQQQVSVARDNNRGAATAIPAAATERISRPAAEPVAAPESKKPALGEVHLASPTLNRPAAQDNSADAPTISSGSPDANAASFSSGLAVGNGKQPAVPEAPLPVGGDVRSAKLISTVSPVYPALAKNQHISGDVRVDALIDATGHVTTMKVISGPTLLHQSAMDALRQWKYQPASLDGKNVPMHLTVTLQFRLQ